jgi:formylglycine-generating enzyme required for sulfatase activity
MLGAAAVVLFAVGMEVYGSYHASATVDRLLSAETADAPGVVRQLAPYYRWAGPRLAAVIDDPRADPRKRLHASLALLPVDAGQSELLRARLLDSAPDECRVISEALAADGEEPAEEFWALLADSTRSARARFRAACALAGWAPSDPRWSQHADEAAAWLVAENSLVLGRWLEILRPVARSLVGPLESLFTRSDRQDLRSNAITVLAEYQGDDWEQLLSLSRKARPPELPVLAASLKRHSSQTVAALRSELAREFPQNASDTAKEAMAKQRAHAGILLCLVGSPDSAWPYLVKAEDPRVRTRLVHGFAAGCVDPAVLRQRLSTEKDASVRRALLWSLGQYEGSVLTGRRCDEVAPLLIAMYLDDPDPGLHSAAEWLLRKWGYSEELAEADKRMKSRDIVPNRDWYVTSQGHTMAIVRGPVRFRMGSRPEDSDASKPLEPLHDETISRSFAIGTKEVSLRQYRLFAPDHLRGPDEPRSLDVSVDRVTLTDAMAYCRWLTEKEGLPEEAMCYVPDKQIGIQVHPDWIKRPGYRLPTDAEWEYACRAGSTTRRYFGHDNEYLSCYAWWLGNSDLMLHPGGLLLPNDLGLFDMYGNVSEWCQSHWGETPTEAGDVAITSMHIIRGGSKSVDPATLRSAYRYASLDSHEGD